MNKTIRADVGVIGVGFGGFAALRALLERGLTVAAVEQYPWIGGQVTSQALCVLDEFHDPVGEEGIGYSRRYAEFREGLRAYYRDNFRLSDLGRSQIYLNAGNSMNSHLVAEPSVAHEVLQATLRPYLESGQLQLHCGWMAATAIQGGRRLEAVECRPVEGGERRLTVEAKFFLDGTEAGDLFPLVPIPFRLGSDGPEFGERHADPAPDPESIQSCTVCFAVEFVPGGSFAIPKPADYEEWRASHGPFYLDAPGARPAQPSRMFRRQEGADGRMIPPAFYYRSVIDARNFDDPARPHSRTIINVSSNDFHGEPVVGATDPEAVYRRAKALSRAYLYWLQTEAPRDEGGRGYPELRLCPEITGTDDGFAMGPYIREGRRLTAWKTIVEEDIATHSQPGARAAHFDDSVGLGCFVIDVHRRTGKNAVGHGGVQARPYQIPLGSLVSPELDNFAVAGKCIGTTQITNGAYRLHNIEWAIGEAAGELAAFCLERPGLPPRLQERELFDYQRRLLGVGIPLFWFDDLGFCDTAFEAIQLLALKRILPVAPRHLRADVQHSVARSLAVIKGLWTNLERLGVETEPLQELCLVAHGSRKGDVAHRVVAWLDRHGWPEEAFRSEAEAPPGDDAEAEACIPASLA